MGSLPRPGILGRRQLSRRQFLAGLAGAATLAAAGAAVDLQRESESASTAHIDPRSPWIQRAGSTLYASGRPFRFGGANMYWLGLDENIRTAAGEPTYPTHGRVDQAFGAATRMGLTMVRAHTLGISVGSSYSLMPERGVINDAAFPSIDYAIATARRHGIRLMVPLVDQWRYYTGGKWVFVHWRAGLIGEDTNPDLSVNAGNNGREKAVEANFYTNSTIISDFQNYVEKLLTHVNPLTGVALKDDPTIAIWETGNELFDSPPSWQAEMGSFLKSLAPQTLTADGSAAHRLLVAEAPGLHAPDIDIVGGHYFPLVATTMQQDLAVALSAGKVFVAGEYDWSNRSGGTPLAEWLQVLADSRCSGDMFWALMPRMANGRPEISSDGFGLTDPPSTDTMATAVSLLSKHARTLSA